MAVAASSIVRLFCAASTGLARANLTTKAKNLFCVNPVISLVPPQIHRRFTSYTREKLFSETSILSDDGKVLHLALQNKDLEMHAVWLRHNCQCPECLSSNGMKTVDPLKLNPSTTAISSVEVSGERINIEWSCGHCGFINIQLLEQLTTKRDDELLVSKELPRVSAEEVLNSDTGLWRWLKNLNEYGHCLLTGLPPQKNEMDKIGALFYSGFQTSCYGMKFNVISSENPENIAYTNVDLAVHQDAVMYESPPGIQLLHCLRNDECVEGGLSTVLDSYPVLEELRIKHPEHFKTLSLVPATFIQNYPLRNRPVMMQYLKPHIRLDRDDKIVAFSWTRHSEGPLWIPNGKTMEYYEAYILLEQMLKESPYRINHKLVPGEVLTVNNRRVLHGRTDIILNGGKRHLEGAYINIDEFKSKFQVLCAMLGHEDYPVKRVFNQCSI